MLCECDTVQENRHYRKATTMMPLSPTASIAVTAFAAAVVVGKMENVH